MCQTVQDQHYWFLVISLALSRLWKKRSERCRVYTKKLKWFFLPRLWLPKEWRTDKTKEGLRLQKLKNQTRIVSCLEILFQPAPRPWHFWWLVRGLGVSSTPPLFSFLIGTLCQQATAVEALRHSGQGYPLVCSKGPTAHCAQSSCRLNGRGSLFVFFATKDCSHQYCVGTGQTHKSHWGACHRKTPMWG